MDLNNDQSMAEELLDEFDISSSNEMDKKEMAKRIFKLEAALQQMEANSNRFGEPSRMQMGQSNSQNTFEDNSLDKYEFDISSLSSNKMDKKEMAKRIFKLEAALQQMETNSNRFGEPSRMQMGWKIDKIEKEIDGKSANRVELGAFGKFKAGMAKMKVAFGGSKGKEDEENSAFEGLKAEKYKKRTKLEGSNQALLKLNNEFARENVELKRIIFENDREMGKMKAKIQNLAEVNVFLGARMCEFVKQIADENSIANLTQKIDGIELVQFNKWDAADSATELVISEGGLFVMNTSKHYGWNCIRAISPVSPFNLDAQKPICAYFEVKIVGKNPNLNTSTVGIGFCTLQFPLNGEIPGNGNNSIGINVSGQGMGIDGLNKRFAKIVGEFEVENVIGVGIIHFPKNSAMKCFATWNDDLLGEFPLRPKFAHLQLFPVAHFYNNGDSIRTNFGVQGKWRFNLNKLLQ